jgi:hypothetical protein
MEAQQVALSALPHVVTHRIFALLPVDQRARSACVCRAWRALLDDASLWTRLDLSQESGVAVRDSTRVLRGAAARAGGALEALDLDRDGTVTLDALLAVLRANSGTLRQLRTGSFMSIGNEVTPADLAALLRAAPALRELSADVCSEAEQAPAMLRNEPPYGPLRLRTLSMPMQRADHAATAAVFAALPAHKSLRSLVLANARLQSEAACAALVDAALAARLPSLELMWCALSPAFASALARLLRAGTLTGLLLNMCRGLLEAPAATAALASALEENMTLTSLKLTAVVGLWEAHLPSAVLLRALTGHPSLQKLHCGYNIVADAAAAAAAGEALRALVAADAPALTELDVSACRWLGDAALGPLVDALPRNTHLRSLVIAGNGITEAFAAQRLLPAVRANASLRELRANEYYGAAPSLAEALRLVGARAGADGAGAAAAGA